MIDWLLVLSIAVKSFILRPSQQRVVACRMPPSPQSRSLLTPPTEVPRWTRPLPFAFRLTKACPWVTTCDHPSGYTVYAQTQTNT